MRRTIGLLLLSAALLGLTGCGHPEQAAVVPLTNTVAQTRTAAVGQAQPALPTVKLWLGAKELVTEVASNDRQRMAGMMFRTNLAENAAMLFVFPFPHQTAFWMKNTLVPLSAAYIDPEGIIREIHALHPLDTNSVEASRADIQFVLETNQGWFERNGIGVGTLVRTDRGSLQQTFLRGQ